MYRENRNPIPAFFLIISLLLVFFSCNPKPEQVKIAVLGHVYYVARDSLVFDQLLSSISEKEPDYVFVLGDMVWANVDWEWEIVKKGFESLDCPIYYAPGNHDLMFVNEVGNGIDTSLQRSWDQYGERIGYYYHFFEDLYANYLFLNSNDSAQNIIPFIKQARNKSDSSKPTFVFAHHQLWQPGKKNYLLMSSLHFKGFEWDEISEELIGVNYIFDGDRNKTFTSTKRPEGFSSVSVGMGDKGDPVYYGWIEIDENGVEISEAKVEANDTTHWKPKESQ